MVTDILLFFILMVLFLGWYETSQSKGVKQLRIWYSMARRWLRLALRRLTHRG